ncbi:transglycosylase SLT domain-containing protein [Nocardia vinacea]|uniref:aggregation-promoting factor C-terminal-like domain-containing protein n=1 Tax=Nocardia vinacea TaxID=96468 RepID=UPI0002F8B10C|nr:transglycosylase SLT domain-containing protein [Nocardia vinacea]
MLRVVAAAIAVSALMVCAGPAVAEGLGDSVVTFANAPNDDATTSADSLADSGPTSADGLNDSAATSADSPDNGAATSADSPDKSAAASADSPGESVTTSAAGLGDSVTPPANDPDDSLATPTDCLGESLTTSPGTLNDGVTPPANGPDDSLVTSADETEETDDTIAVTPAASPPDSGTNPAGLALSLVRLGTRALALTVVPLHQFPAFDAVITHESGWDVFAINPKSGAYGLGQALPAEKMQTHGADWRFNPLTQIRWTYDYMNARYGSPDGAWAFWQQHHWY